jgi:TonB family protein
VDAINRTPLDLAPIAPPRLPDHGTRGRLVSVATAAGLHAAAAALVVTLSGHVHPQRAGEAVVPRTNDAISVDLGALLFVPSQPAPTLPAAGGGGGGNQQAGPIRRASGIGDDAITLRTRKPSALADVAAVLPPDALPAVVLDAKPLASGTFDQLGLPVGGVSYGTSTGPGSGGGVGTGIGTGIGPGRGPGIGPGEGGGIGGGVYRPGGAVTAPRVLTQVQPAYTADALQRHVQGTVELEIVVRRDGCASDLRVVRSLDPGGLDEQAIRAVSQWRFEPGRLAGAPVDVVSRVVIDFTIR